VIFHDRFLVHAIARDPYAGRPIHEATGVPLATVYAWRDHLEVDATWRPWSHKVSHGFHSRRLNDIEEKRIEEALNERSVRGEKIDGKLVQIVVRQITLETRRVWIDMCLSSMCRLMHRLGFTPRAAHVRRPKRRTRTRGPHSRRRGWHPCWSQFQSQQSD
jgi:transposase